MNTKRLLFASIHSYLDPSSGAALATREVLEMMAARGWDCRALTCGVLDYAEETPLDDVLAALERPMPRARAALSRGGNAEVFDLELGGVRVTLLPTNHSRADKAPSPREARIFLDLAEQVLDRFRPECAVDIRRTPGLSRADAPGAARGIAVVFHLHNFGYNDRRGFTDVSAIIFPSEYSRRHYRRLGLDGTVIADPIPLDRVDRGEPRAASTSPSSIRSLRRVRRSSPGSPSSWARGGRISRSWWSRGARKSDGLADAAGRPVGADEPEPNGQHARPARLLPSEPRRLMPSFWRESLGRVPIEAMANGIPVLASDRGALPETLGDAGFVFTIPERCTPTSNVVSDRARGRPVGRRHRAALGRPGVRGEAPRTGQGRSEGAGSPTGWPRCMSGSS